MPYFRLNNDQRRCLGLPVVEPHWTWVRLKDSPYEEEGMENWACFDGSCIRRMVRCGPNGYQESVYAEETAEQGADVLPGCQGFRNNGVGGLLLDRSIWERCIAAGTNAPYWDARASRDREIEAAIRSGKPRVLTRDLRNPAYQKELEAVCSQFGLQVNALHIGR